MAVDAMFADAEAYSDTDLKIYTNALAEVLLQGVLIRVTGD